VSTNRIEKQVLLHAPLEHVWRAITDFEQFGRWFGVALDGPFAVGVRSTGKLVPTTVDPEIAKLQRPHEGKPFEVWVERIEPVHTFTYRWHPFAVETSVDYSREPMTLVQFELTESPAGTLLTISETGFEQLPAARRANAFAAHEGGWASQTWLIRGFLGA
jgi:uncharacterized protein YndB with AHSA1/START domain